MYKNYIKIAWRNLTQHKSYTLINIFGLALGMACCVLISLYIKEELSYNQFHDHAERIAAIGKDPASFDRSLSTPYPLADALESEIPEVEKATRMDDTGPLNISSDQQSYTNLQGQYAEPTLFEIFSFDLLLGDKAQALAAPNSIVLSESARGQLFGRDNPVGETVYWQKRDTLISLEVTGVVEDEPGNSSINYEALISFNTIDESRRDPSNWNSNLFLRTFALLKSTDSFESLPASLENLARAHYDSDEESESEPGLFYLPLDSYHLSEITDNKGFTGNQSYVYLFGSIAFLILIIAGVNYVNLATARASLRTKEVGIRKTLGARRGQMVGQFIGESVIMSMIAYLLGGLIATGVLPHFNQLFGTSLTWQAHLPFMAVLIIAAAGIGILSGLYPSLYLSRFSPSEVLSGKKKAHLSGATLRKILVVSQFAIALVLIIGSLIVYQQLRYVQEKDLGFNGDQVAMVELPNRKAWDRRKTIKNNLDGYTGIKELSIANGAPGEFNIMMGFRPDNLSSDNKTGSNEPITIAPAVVDYNFLELLDIDLVAGRGFSTEKGLDKEKAVIINEKGAELLGWTPEEAIGKPFGRKGTDKIIGVVENFHISSLHNNIRAVFLTLEERIPYTLFFGPIGTCKIGSGSHQQFS